jgi:hypothetical protein
VPALLGGSSPRFHPTPRQTDSFCSKNPLYFSLYLLPALAERYSRPPHQVMMNQQCARTEIGRCYPAASNEAWLWLKRFAKLWG